MPIDQKVQRGVEETASRGLEVIQVQYLAIEEPGAAGRMLAQGVRDVCTAVEQSGRLPAVWEAGLRNVLDMLRSGGPGYRWTSPCVAYDSCNSHARGVRNGHTRRTRIG